MKKALTLLTLLACLSEQATAERISIEQARDIATRFVDGHKAYAYHSLTLANASKGHYTFNVGKGNGFVIVAADDDAANCILGYATTGTFLVNDGVRCWLDKYDKEIGTLPQATNTTITKVASAGAATAWEEVKPLITTTWGQGTPFNNDCPEVSGAKAMTGSMTTALAQVMRYQRWPEQATGLSEGTQPYDWDSMADSYGEQSTEQQKKAVAQLMHDIGVAAKTTYAKAYSNTSADSAEMALMNNFGYAHNLALYKKESMTFTDWYQLIYNELRSKRPVVYIGGTSSSIMDAFVCDGYQDGYFHINWGWGGTCDGYFKLSALTPDATGEGSYNNSFSKNERALVGMTRQQDKYGYRPVIYSTDDMSLNMPKANHDTRIVVNIATTFDSPVERNVRLGLTAISEEGDTTFIPGYSDRMMKKGSLCYWYDVSTAQFPTKEGTYKVTPSFLDVESGQWWPIYIHNRNNNHSMTARVKGDDIFFSETGWEGTATATTPQLTEEKVYANRKYTAKTTVTCNAGEYKDKLHVGFMPKDSVAFHGEEDTGTEVHLMEGDSQDISIACTTPTTPGDYYMAVFSGEGFAHCVSDSMLVTVNEPYAKLLITSKLIVTNADQVDPNDMEIKAVVRCDEGHYDNKFIAYFTDSNRKKIYGSIEQDVAISQHEEPETVVVRGTFANATPGMKYIVKLYYYDENGKLAAVPANGTGYMNQNSAYFTVASESAINTTEAENAPKDIRIYSLNGKLLHRQKGSKADLSKLAKGVYLITTNGHTERVTVTE